MFGLIGLTLRKFSSVPALVGCGLGGHRGQATTALQVQIGPDNLSGDLGFLPRSPFWENKAMQNQPKMFPLDSNADIYAIQDEHGRTIGTGTREVCEVLLFMLARRMNPQA